MVRKTRYAIKKEDALKFVTLFRPGSFWSSTPGGEGCRFRLLPKRREFKIYDNETWRVDSTADYYIAASVLLGEIQ